MQKYPNNLRLLREWRNLTQEALADTAICSQTSISVYEKGCRPIPLELQESFAETLKVPVRMICEPVTVILRSWERLVLDPRMPILVEEILSWDSKRLSRMVHRVAEGQVHNYAL